MICAEAPGLGSAGVGNVVFIEEVNPVSATVSCLGRADPSALGWEVS